MRAELPKREPAFLAKWREEKIYDRILAARKEAAQDPATTFVLHDGPPFANGDAHMGHALNMVLKDIVLKYHNMSGHYAPFVPGWDCHGLPIEHKVMKELGAAETDPLKIREKCEATARHFVNVQREQFERLGVFGDWDQSLPHPRPGLRGRDAARLRHAGRQKSRLPGPAPRPLEHRLPDRARRSRDRVQGEGRSGDLCEVSADAGQPREIPRV